MTVVRKNRQPVTDHRIKRYCCFEQILLNFAETRAEVLHDLTIVRTLRGFHSFSFPYCNKPCNSVHNASVIMPPSFRSEIREPQERIRLPGESDSFS